MKEHIKRFVCNDIVLQNGEIQYHYDKVLGQAWSVTYENPEIDYYKYQVVPTLQEAFRLYEKWYNNMRGA
jgi:hypothetical protein